MGRPGPPPRCELPRPLRPARSQGRRAVRAAGGGGPFTPRRRSPLCSPQVLSVCFPAEQTCSVTGLCPAADTRSVLSPVRRGPGVPAQVKRLSSSDPRLKTEFVGTERGVEEGPQPQAGMSLRRRRYCHSWRNLRRSCSVGLLAPGSIGSGAVRLRGPARGVGQLPQRPAQPPAGSERGASTLSAPVQRLSKKLGFP